MRGGFIAMQYSRTKSSEFNTFQEKRQEPPYCYSDRGVVVNL